MTQLNSSSASHGDNIFKAWRETPIPEHTIGQCVRWRYCRQFNADLGNGYCVDCWDRGYGNGRRQGEDHSLSHRNYTPS